MSQILSNPFDVNVIVAPIFAPPYGLPSPGNALVVGTTTGAGIPDGIRPSPLSSGGWNNALFGGGYGAGVWVRDWSPGGGYVIAGTGGHKVTPNSGAAIFDFSDLLWKRVDNSNGMPWRASGPSGTIFNGNLEDVAGGGAVNEHSLAPEYRITIAGVTGDMPAHHHTYNHSLPISTARGGGPRGSVLQTMRSAIQLAGNGTCFRTYQFNLDTGLWSKLSTNFICPDIVPAPPTVWDTCSVLDELNGHCYVFPISIHSHNRTARLDMADWTWKSSGTYPTPPTTASSSQCYDPVRQWILLFAAAQNVIRRLDLTDIADGWRPLNVTGTVTAHHRNKWHHYPVADGGDGNFYTYSSAPQVGPPADPNANWSGQNLERLIPPSSSPLTNPWVLDQRPLGGDALIPNQGTTTHYGRFFYVPSIRCFCWMPGYSTRVFLIKP